MCDAGNLPLKGDIADFSCTYSFFHHVPDGEKVLFEIIRVTKKAKVTLYFDHDKFTNESTAVMKQKLIKAH